jgi:hypothetical protein
MCCELWILLSNIGESAMCLPSSYSYKQGKRRKASRIKPFDFFFSFFSLFWAALMPVALAFAAAYPTPPPAWNAGASNACQAVSTSVRARSC